MWVLVIAFISFIVGLLIICNVIPSITPSFSLLLWFITLVALLLKRNLIQVLILDPYPLRTIYLEIIRKFNLGSYLYRLNLGVVDRPHYGYCVYHAAVLAQKLGYRKISVLEYGVAGGNGLVNLEYHTNEISKLLDIEFEIYGFDTGEGLPEPVDYRDAPYNWEKGFYKMDLEKLQARLTKAKLVLGDIKDTAINFFEKFDPAPIGVMIHDLDLYSSTANALKMLEAGEENFLPRVFCYFDDTVGTEVELYNDFTGERLAIHEFNQKHTDIKLGFAYLLYQKKIVEPWFHRIWVCHFFKHKYYNTFISKEDATLTLDGLN